MENNEVVQLYLDDIIPNRFQPREVFNDQALKELAISIREHGVIQPIIVRKFGEKYEIIAGERRYKASTMAGLTKIPAIVKNLDDKESSKVALIENLQRRDLTPIEEARTYQKILDLDEMTQEDLAKTMGKSQSAVSNKLRLLSLPDEIQEALLKEEISERHARSLLNIDDKNVQIDLLKEIVNNKMTVRELDSRIKKITNNDRDSNNDGDVSGGSNLKFEEEKELDLDKPLEKVSETNNTFEVELLDGPINSNVSEPVKEEFEVELISDDKIPQSDVIADGRPAEVSNDLFLEKEKDESMNNNSLFGDPTTVDINSIRENSTDINFGNAPKENADMKSLLNPGGFKEESTSNMTFINFDEEPKTEEVKEETLPVGSSLLSGMPEIKTTESSNSLFSTPTVDTIKETSSSSLFGSFNQNATNNDSVISNNNVEVAVNEVRDVVNSYKMKGYDISVEQLDLDREIQLIIKFNKN